VGCLCYRTNIFTRWQLQWMMQLMFTSSWPHFRASNMGESQWKTHPVICTSTQNGHRETWRDLKHSSLHGAMLCSLMSSCLLFRMWFVMNFGTKSHHQAGRLSIFLLFICFVLSHFVVVEYWSFTYWWRTNSEVYSSVYQAVYLMPYGTCFLETTWILHRQF